MTLFKSDRNIILWLFSGFFLVFAMVVIGGITRLTGSGLSMVDWDPIMGIIPPLNEADWQEKFEMYKMSPEFNLVNSHFNLSDFKSIFWWEFIHRFLGRLIGLVFLIPFIFFWWKKYFTRSLLTKCLIIFVLGGLQGGLGWYMVASGLVKDPHVSHFRLAAHFLTALTVMMYIWWVILDILYPKKQKWNLLRRDGICVAGLLMVQLFYGALTAGLKAGFMYNTWPLMGDALIPDVVGNEGWSGLFSHGPTVQFIHRTLGIFVVLGVVYLWFRYRKLNINPNVKIGLKWLNVMVLVQFLLGVLTLLTVVNISLGVVHQACAVLLLAALIFVIHESTEKEVEMN